METSSPVLPPEQEITIKLKRPRFWPMILALYRKRKLTALEMSRNYEGISKR